MHLRRIATPANEKWVFQDVEMSENAGYLVTQAILQGNATATSDRSFKEEYGTAGWTLRGDNKLNYITGALVTISECIS